NPRSGGGRPGEGARRARPARPAPPRGRRRRRRAPRGRRSHGIDRDRARERVFRPSRRAGVEPRRADQHPDRTARRVAQRRDGRHRDRLRSGPPAASSAVNLAEAQQLLERAESEAATAAEATAELDELAELERRYVGRRSPAAQVTEAIKTLAPEDRRPAGKAVSDYKAAIATLLERRRGAIAASEATGGPRGERLDLTAGGHGRARGHLHLVTQVQRELEDIFAGLG